MGCAITGCDETADPSFPPRQSSPAPTPAPTPAANSPVAKPTGTLTVSVADPEGRPLVDAWVTVWNRDTGGRVDSARTSAAGVATIDSVPAAARVHAFHAFGEDYRTGNVDVAQDGVTFFAVTMKPARPRPTVALLPVSIPAGSVNADRSELKLQVTIVASASGPFAPSGYGDYSDVSTPYLGLQLGRSSNSDFSRQCYVWLDRTRTVPSCGSWGESIYTVAVEQFQYDPVGTVPLLAQQGRTESALLILDQSGRVPELDPHARRSLAARAFIARTVTSSEPRSLSVAGFAGDGSAPASQVHLPERPLWSPLGSGSVFSTDRAVLQAGVGILEPLVGGSAPVFDALQAAIALTVARAPPGNRGVVALLGGGDDRDLSESARQAALASLRRQRDDAGIQAVLIAAAPASEHAERVALAELSTALRAPAISFGVVLAASGLGAPQTWESGSYAALDLAADLIDGIPLPSLSAMFRVSANQPGAFPAGATLHGTLYVLSELCPFSCLEISLEFAAEIP
jgi:hypothetical protein